MSDFLTMGLDFLIPDRIPVWGFCLLVGISFVTSAISATVGLGGGMTLLGVLGSVVPASALVAIHSFVQLGSNISRAVVQRDHIVWPVMARFAAGSIVGAIIGGLTVTSLPEHSISLIIGTFILVMVWGPKLKVESAPLWALPFAGMFATFLSMLFGATGPIVSTIMRRIIPKKENYIGTQAACMVLQNIFKISVFLSLGFAIWDWIGLIIAMVISGALGTVLGSRLLEKMSQETFDKVFKTLLTLVAINLLYHGLVPYFESLP